MGTVTHIEPSEDTPSVSYQTSDLWHNDKCLKRLIELYFNYKGKIKYVSQKLGIRRNSVINAIKGRMIPYIAKIWIEECGGDQILLAKKLGLKDDDSFRKTLRWHQRFETYLSSISPGHQNAALIKKALVFLRTNPKSHFTSPLITSQQPLVVSESERATKLTFKDSETDDIQTISGKITQLKTLKYATMMILGETGVGKGWLAKRIYHYLYPEKDKPFIHINCAHIISAAVELFGCAKGAFTDAVPKTGAFEKIINGGLLFLDEIDCLPMDAQLRLLLALGEEGTFSRVGSSESIQLKKFTLITATNQSLDSCVKSNRFRKDLLGRIEKPFIKLKTWQQQPLSIKMFIIDELQKDIIQNDFEAQYASQIETNFQLLPEQIDLLLNSEYAYNIRSIRKQIIHYMTEYLLKHNKNTLVPFKFQ